ncbi:formate dehydrogenase accessory sulfurtransferase FdhD [Myxococcus sp. K15C18031901]|uniref:formate dehydrogenase accessory sulfurtransferase FdhD n=1 Tax=Myxococcus dinghuensis TaxID=2906761 RepID=UPI0020A7DB7C|nr:formate dehydrogenase accessory sulfurtransferase FdhD [Myxococcus dinghuensis]MCP3103056.1 formate dehydrogenase accessory sulfurtransferase FdhD [Myxococcus dinghuensis]
MSPVPAFSIIGWSGAGKTTLLSRLVAELTSRGVRVAAVKHSSDPHPLHRPGSDTARFQQAGAAPTGFSTPDGTQLTYTRDALPALLSRLAGTVDLVLVEGWKDGPLPKLEVWREGLGPPLAPTRPDVLAVVTDAPALPAEFAQAAQSLRKLPSGDVPAVADFVLALSRPRPPAPADTRGVGTRGVRRWDGDTLGPEQEDALAVEEPLEIRVSGEPLAITMRTPGHDRELAVGFLLAEGLIQRADDLGGLAHCGRPGEEGWGNVMEVTPAPGVILDLERLSATRRGTLTTSACGVCGRRTVDDLLAVRRPLPPGPVLSARAVARATERLRDAQRAFARTGGTHAAAALDARGEVLAAFEDVGRHNAVDKVVGALELARARATGSGLTRQAVVLAVSGRVSFEIVQKAVAARIPVVAGVSAASTLAVDLALRSNLTLATFVRAGRFNVHAGSERLARTQPLETPASAPDESAPPGTAVDLGSDRHRRCNAVAASDFQDGKYGDFT